VLHRRVAFTDTFFSRSTHVAHRNHQTYIQQVKKNAKVLAETLVSKGYSVVTGGTDNHLGT
jgi:glycine/serine hydroxymethyltransferase